MLFDWRTLLRFLSGRPSIDVVFITNMRDEVDRKRFLGSWVPPEGHFNGPRYWFKGVAARTRALNVTAKDLVTHAGRREAKKQFLAAVQWAQQKGARVILLAAGTKRLFGRHGEELRRRFPDMFFTIGDNGTASLLEQETLRAMRSAGLYPGFSRICVIGPTGILGRAIAARCEALGYAVVGLCSSMERVSGCAIEAYTSFTEVGKVDAVVACSHLEAVSLSPDVVRLLKREKRKLLVIDVAEPSNMSHATYEECRHLVVRQDAGNAYSPDLKYVLGAVSYRLFRMTQGVAFGCFAEALAIGAELSAGHAIDFDGLAVSDENTRMARRLLERYGFGVPTPRCFGTAVTSFSLKEELTVDVLRV